MKAIIEAMVILCDLTHLFRLVFEIERNPKKDIQQSTIFHLHICRMLSKIGSRFFRRRSFTAVFFQHLCLTLGYNDILLFFVNSAHFSLLQNRHLGTSAICDKRSRCVSFKKEIYTYEKWLKLKLLLCYGCLFQYEDSSKQKSLKL